MNATTIVSTSLLALLAALLGGGIWLKHGGTARPVPGLADATLQTPAPGPAAPAPPVNRSTVTESGTTGAGSGLPRWEEVESDDYRTYIANLRAVGCPETTIADILRADVHALFTARRRALVGGATTAAYWRRPQATGVVDGDSRLAQLAEEEAGLLKALLGDSVTPLPPSVGTAASAPAALGLPELPPERLALIRNLETERDLRLQSTAATVGGADLPRAFAAAEAELRQRLEATLSPEELRTYDLATSPVAEELRHRQIGFELSEAEFNTLFDLRREADERTRQLEAAGDRTAAHQVQAEAFERMKGVLGEERWAKYERAGDPEYLALLRAQEGTGLPVERLEEAYARSTAAQQHAGEFLADGERDRSARLGAIAELDANLNDQLRELLGDEGWSRYRDAGGDALAAHREQAASGWVAGLPPGDAGPGSLTPDAPTSSAGAMADAAGLAPMP